MAPMFRLVPVLSVLIGLLASIAAGCAGPQRTKDSQKTDELPPASAGIQYAEVEGGRLAYELSGSGPALVLVNGGAMDMRQWDLVLPELAQHCRVLRYDPRGWGRSSLPTAPFSNVDDLEALLAALHIEQANFVGCSFGGGLALDLALEHPDRVHALVLCGSSLGGFPWSKEFQERDARFFRASDEERAGLILADPNFVPGARSDPGLRERVSTLIGENAGLFHWDPALIRWPKTPAIERLADVRAPTLVLVSQKDHPQVIFVASTLARQIPGARARGIADAGHMAQLEQPADFARAVLDFFARPEVARGWKLVYEQRCEDERSVRDFQASDPNAWRRGAIESAPGYSRECLEQFAASQYEPAYRSPYNLALLATPKLDSFVVEASVMQTGREYPHRDLVFVFGFRDPEHYLYAHLASTADDNAHQVMLVDGAPRRPVTSARTSGVDWGTGEWKPLRVEREASTSSVRVWLGKSAEPELVAEGTAPGDGWIGFGSFDDTGAFTDIRVWAPEAKDERVPFFQPLSEQLPSAPD